MDLRPYQEEACAFLDRHGRAIYADAPGTGKTPTTLQWLRDVEADTSLIVAPLPVLDHWQDEAALWHPDLLVFRMTGTPEAREASRERFLAADGPKALLTHYEGLRIDVKHLTRHHFGALVCDEAHRLKGRSTLVTKAARLMARRSDKVALLTGTPVLNRAEELWSLLNLLDPKEHSSFWAFVHRYFETEQRNFGGSPRPVTLIHDVREDRLDDLRGLVKPVMIQRTLDECLPDMAEAVEVMVPVHLTPAERKVYKQMEKHGWAQTAPGEVLQAPNELAKGTRLRQMSSDFGAVLGEEVAGSKAKRTIELLNDDLAGEQVVVLTAYKATARSIHAGVEGAVLYTGDEAGPERLSALEAFKSGEARVLVGTLATLGEGVDGLQVARYIVLVDRDWTPARNEQAIARLRRSGQTSTVVVYQVYAEGTIDEDVALALARKETIIEKVLG